MGTCQFLGQRTVKVKEFGPDIEWKTYREVGEDVMNFGAALRSSKVGIVPSPSSWTLDRITEPCSIAIFENTCAEWMIAAQGAFSQGVIVTTIYATLGIDAMVEAIQNGSIQVMLCNAINVKGLTERLGDMPTLKTIIYTSVS